ncbi:MAG TPA: hypothetical protein VME43_13635 [Bryobacteraceae bacterium]|nr:hypothetical protein [Bryobacteraceae bacterium]
MTKTVGLLALTLAALPAMASSITFTISATATGSFSGGSLNGDTFTNALITFIQTTDTTDISSSTCGYPCSPDVAGNTVTIAGLGTVTLSGDTYFFDNAINIVGITNESGSAYLGADDGSVFGSYTLTTLLASASYPIYSGSAVSDVATSGGSLSITSFGDSATFQACAGCAVASTPEPGPLGLVCVGAILLAAGLFRRRRGSTACVRP